MWEQRRDYPILGSSNNPLENALEQIDRKQHENDDYQDRDDVHLILSSV